eukprot:TRINITY_DN3443_c0_g1_i2.p1 TRINITY_DN3443_c0_g1~~TRINITY_DN3443_c0_g1_i2.p1  ORF type:complete len:180 (+),score=35.81 TRINITY_DN3443_c0_g1_i2:29-541(+)
MISFILVVNKEGQTRLSQYYEHLPLDERNAMEASLVRLCMSRTELQCSFVEYLRYKIVYRRYASLFFIVGTDHQENELGVLEFIHAYVETLDQYFENVVWLSILTSCFVCSGAVCCFWWSHSVPQCELDIVLHLDKAHIILDEMVMNGCIVETNKPNILGLLRTLNSTDK